MIIDLHRLELPKVAPKPEAPGSSPGGDIPLRGKLVRRESLAPVFRVFCWENQVFPAKNENETKF